jgi:sphingolipid 4-desaturase/C4-monooxygenase
VLPFAYAARTDRMIAVAERKPAHGDSPTVALLVAQMAVLGIVVYLAGFGAIGYLSASIYFAVGPHPLAMRLVQEHGQREPGGLTSSYYGPLNRIMFNLGYHVEHHDFPNIPWHRLPQLRAIAPDWYPGPSAYRTRFRGFFAFIFDRRLDLWDRCIRRQ